MIEPYLEWLPVVGGLLGGTMLVAGLLIGACNSLKRVFGYSNRALCGASEESLGILPLAILRIGALSTIGGIIWLYVFHESSIEYGISLGGILGLVSISLAKKMDYKEDGNNESMLSKIGAVRGIGPILGGGVLVIFYLIIGGILGAIAGGILGLLVGFFLDSRGAALNTIASGMMAGGTIGGIGGGIRGMKAGVAIGGKGVREFVGWLIIGGLGFGIAGGLVSGIQGFITGAFTGMSTGGIVYASPFLLFPIEWLIASALSALMSPLLILVRFRTILCNNCLRYTRPLKSKYKEGRRYCERCRRDVEFTRDRGEVLLNFGDIHVHPEGRVFILADPDFEQKTKGIEVSKVYLDPKTCNPFLLEKFVTYILNYPPESGLASVRIFYKGELHELGENLKNTLQNTFASVEQLKP